MCHFVVAWSPQVMVPYWGLSVGLDYWQIECFSRSSSWMSLSRNNRADTHLDLSPSMIKHKIKDTSSSASWSQSEFNEGDHTVVCLGFSHTACLCMNPNRQWIATGPTQLHQVAGLTELSS